MPLDQDCSMAPARSSWQTCFLPSSLPRLLLASNGHVVPPPAPTAQVNLQPTVTVQTLHGHKGTITGIKVHGDHIMSSSTDGSVRVWRAVEGRGQLMYPWFDLQVGRGVAALLNAGVTVMGNGGCSYTHIPGDQAQGFTRAHRPAPQPHF